MRILLLAIMLALAAGASAQPAATGAGGWPSRAIHMIVPFPAGSSPDLIARVLAEKLAPALGQPVIVENRPGAGGNLGTALVAKAAPDGYTVGISIPGPLAVNSVLYRKMEYDPFKDLAPVSLVGASPNVLVVDPKLNVDSVREFVALAKSQPGKLNYGSVGNGSTSHLTMELFKEAAGLGTSNESNSMNQLDGSILLLAISLPAARMGFGPPEKSEVHDETTPASGHCSTRIRRLRLSAQVGTGDDGRRRRPRKDGRY